MDEEIRRAVLAKIAGHYSQLNVTLRSALLVEGEGIELRGLSIADPSASPNQSQLAVIEEMFLTCDTSIKDLLSKCPKVTHIKIRQPVLHAACEPSGTWTIQKLHPWPKFGETAPEIEVEGATLEILDALKSPASVYTVRDVHLLLKPRLTSGKQHALDVAGSLRPDQVRSVKFAGNLAPATLGFDVQGGIEGLEVSPELRDCLPTCLADPIKCLGTLRGQARGEFRLTRTDSAAAVAYQVEGELARGRLDDPRLPYPLTDLQGRLSANNAGFRLHGVTARAGRTTLRLSYSQRGYVSTSQREVAAFAENLQLESRVAETLPDPLRNAWYKYLPEGNVNADARLSYDGRRWQSSVELACLDTAFTFYRFPYRVEHATGRIALTNQQLTARLTAYSGGEPIRIEASVRDPGPHYTGFVQVDADNIPFDEKLFAALPNPSQGVVRSLNPRGNFAVSARHWRASDETLQHQRISLNLNRCSINYEKFRYPVGNIRGHIEMVDGRWNFRDLAGSNDRGFITCNGQLVPGQGGLHLGLAFSGRDIPLEEELRDALPPGMARLWNVLRPRGSFNLPIVHVDYSTAAKRMSVSLRAEPDGETSSIEPLCFPYRMERLAGALAYRDGHVELENLRAVHGRTSLRTGGQCDFAPDGSWQLELRNLTVDRLRADHELIAALPGRLKKAVVELKPTGPLYLRGTLGFVGDGRERLNARWNLDLGMHQGSLDCGIQLNNIFGTVKLAGQSSPDQFAARGELAIDSLMYKNAQVTNIRGPIWLDEKRVLAGAWPELRSPEGLRSLTGKVYGGTIEANSKVMLGVPAQYFFAARMTDANLAQFAQENLTGQQKLAGKLAGEVRLSGDTRGTHTLSGTGFVRLRDADVYQLPVMLALLKTLSLREPSTTAFTSSDIDFRIRGEHLLLNRIEFRGDAVSLMGQGEAGLDRHLNLAFQAVVGRNELPLLKQLMSTASQQIMQLHVTGSMDRPTVVPEALPGLAQAIQDVQASMPRLDQQAPSPREAGLPRQLR